MHVFPARRSVRTVDAVRLVWGALLVARPGLLLRTAGSGGSPGTLAIARVLGSPVSVGTVVPAVVGARSGMSTPGAATVLRELTAPTRGSVALTGRFLDGLVHLTALGRDSVADAIRTRLGERLPSGWVAVVADRAAPAPQVSAERARLAELWGCARRAPARACPDTTAALCAADLEARWIFERVRAQLQSGSGAQWGRVRALEQYDEEHGSDLCKSVRVYVSEGRDVRRSAGDSSSTRTPFGSGYARLAPFRDSTSPMRTSPWCSIS